MAKKTFTDIVTGDHDQNSPYEEGQVGTFRDNNLTLLKSPFYLRWWDAVPAGADDSRSVFQRNSPSWTVRPDWWPITIHPGAERLVISFFASVTVAGTDGNCRWSLQVDAPGATADVADEVASWGTPTLYPTTERLTATFTKAMLQPRWGRIARLRLEVIRNAGTGKIRIDEDPEARCYWEQNT